MFTQQYDEMDFPLECVEDVQNTQVILEDDWIYFRQLWDSNNPDADLDECVYRMEDDSIPVLAERREIKPLFREHYRNTKLRIVQSNGNLRVISRAINTAGEDKFNRYIVRATKIYGESAYEGKMQIGDKIIPCTQGCKICNTAGCETCEEGWTLINGGKCAICAEGCASCLATDENNCDKCMSKYYQANTACVACSENCDECSGTADTCTSCGLGYFLNTTENTCDDCPNQCLQCNSSTFCEKCD